MKCAIETLTLAISLGVVWSTAGFLNSISTAQLLDYLCLETSSLIRVNPLRYPLDEEPIANQSLDDGASSLISGWHSDSKLREHVSEY